ncbi:Magnesium dechelatase SGR1, chloroplastic, partial [Linum perenne]
MSIFPSRRKPLSRNKGVSLASPVKMRWWQSGRRLKGRYLSMVHCHISGGGHFLLELYAKLRYFIFCKQLPVVRRWLVNYFCKELPSNSYASRCVLMLILVECVNDPIGGNLVQRICTRMYRVGKQ